MTSWCGFKCVMLPKGLLLPSLLKNTRKDSLLCNFFPHHLWTNVVCWDCPVSPQGSSEHRDCDRNSREGNSYEHPPDPSWVFIPAVNLVCWVNWLGVWWSLNPRETFALSVLTVLCNVWPHEPPCMDSPWQGPAGQMTTAGRSCSGCSASSTSLQPAVWDGFRSSQVIWIS